MTEAGGGAQASAPAEAAGGGAPEEVSGDREPLAQSPSLDASPEVTPPPTAYRVMEVDTVELDLPAQYPAVTLVEAEPPMRTLVFPVGLPEGTAMALALRRMSSPKPMTHELMVEVFKRVRIDVIAVRLVGREHGNYLAEIDLMTQQGRERIPCRPSDGMVLALRMVPPSPILADERLLEQSGDVVPQGD